MSPAAEPAAAPADDLVTEEMVAEAVRVLRQMWGWNWQFPATDVHAALRAVAPMVAARGRLATERELGFDAAADAAASIAEAIAKRG
jgi:hypothetical protein